MKCSKCGRRKGTVCFSKKTDSRTGYRSYCKACHRRNSRQWYENNKERRKEYSRLWIKANHKRWLALGRQWRKNNPEKVRRSRKRWLDKNPGYSVSKTREYRRKYPERYNGYARNQRQRIKSGVINLYGGRCKCCGETNPFFLTLDHVLNDGAKHRLKMGRPNDKIYRSIFRGGKQIREFQILCANCNLGKYWNKGVCPHLLSKGPTSKSRDRILGKTSKL